MPYICYDRQTWLKIEGGGATTGYGVQLNGASASVVLPAGAQFGTSDFSKVSVLTEDGYKPVTEEDIRVE